MFEHADEVIQVVRFKVSQTKDAELFVQQPDKLAEIYSGNFDKNFPGFERRNWLLAYAAYHYLARRDDFIPIESGQLQPTQFLVPGRMEQFVFGEVTVIFDGAHNQPRWKHP